VAGRATFKKGAKIARIENNLDNPQRALKQIGVLMVAESQRAFKDQAFGGKKWPARGAVNVFGIIADFAAGRKPPARRFESRPALRDTGRLASSIAFQLVGTNVVEVGTNVQYAAVHQTGGKVQSATITAELQAALWKWLRNQSAQLKRRLGFLLNKKFTNTSLEGTVPARKFVGITRQTREFVRRAVGVEIMEAK
jgi:phage gpG-like protein